MMGAKRGFRPALLLVLALGAGACADRGGPTQPAVRMAMDSNQNAVNGAPSGFTPGWKDGQTVTFFYTKEFFCRLPVADGMPVGSTSSARLGRMGR